ncbi:hypothetical protein [Streptomyces daliensis]|uniref:Uncharacterized protein n=1 Tax=Streptomyces daliensis TaxID=299421 RepID=A0A8T4J1Z5_9ACTN|nr:hypothetical protein [Streptomyces daliensis]
MLAFIRSGLEAEGVAHARHARPLQWEVGDEWHRTARPAMDGLRIAESGVQPLCAPALHAPATACARALNQAVWQEGDGTSLAERLEPFRAEFLAVARRTLS